MENDFISFCWPFYNGYGMYFEDTGVLAFSHKVNIGDDVIVTNAAFDKLKAGWALKDAVDNIVDVAFNLGLTQELYSGGTEPYSLTNVVILGDQWTNIKNVYSPVTRTLNWFKEVPMP